MTIAVFVLAALLQAEAAAPTPPAKQHVGVITFGADPAEAGALQSSLEEKVRHLPNVELEPSDLLARRIQPQGAATGLAAGFAAHKDLFDRLIQAAAARISDGDWDAAREQLDGAGKLLKNLTSPPASAQAELFAWRIELAEDTKDERGARDLATRLVAIKPDFLADQSIFIPQVGAYVDGARNPVVPQGWGVTLMGLPEDAEVVVDGFLQAGKHFAVQAGGHTITASGPGMRSVAVTRQVTRDTEIPFSLPLHLEDAREQKLQAIVLHGEPDGAERSALDTLAKELGLDGLVLAVIQQNSMRAYSDWVKDPQQSAATPVLSVTLENRLDLADNVGAIVAQAAAAAVAVPAKVEPPKVEPTPAPPTVEPTPGPGSGPEPVAAASTGLSVDGGLAYANDSRVLGPSGNTLSSSFTGYGPEIRVGYHNGSLVGGARAAFLLYGGSSSSFSAGAGSSASVAGANEISSEIEGGYRLGFGEAPEAGGVALLVGVGIDDHLGANDLQIGTTNAGVFDSYLRVAPGLGARLAYPAGPVEIGAWLKGGYGFTSGTPAQAAGTAAAGLLVSGSLGGRFRATDALAFGADLRMDYWMATMSGTPGSAALPGVADGALTEATSMVVVSARYVF